MIRLGLRLTLNGGREAAVRLVVTSAAVALGVGLLLIALAGMNALNAQNARSAWLNTGMMPGPPAATTADPLWWLSTTDYFANHTIDRVDVAATGPDSPVPPGLARLPGPGEFYASPALARLLRTTAPAELGDRFPGRDIGTIGPAGLPAPNSLVIVIGRTAAQLSSTASEVTSINAEVAHPGGPNGWDANKLQVVLAVGVLALLFPVLIFIATATRLSATRREQRFAAMRLVGATPRQVSVVAAVEAGVAALAGVAVGFGVFFLLRPLLTKVPFTGEPFSPGDLSLGAVDILLVAIGVPLAAAGAARVALRRVLISPLGVTRRVTPPAPRAYRLVPLAAGIAELLYFVEVGRPKSTGAQIDAYFTGCFLIMAGLLIAGPWLTMVGSRAMARRTSGAATLIAGRRLSDNPRAGFRAISGLIIALFATSVSVGVITTILDYNGASGGTASSKTLVDQFGSFFGPRVSAPAPGQPAVPTVSVPPTLLTKLTSIRGVRGVTLIYSDPSTTPNGHPRLLVACNQLAHTPALGRSAPGTAVAIITGNLDSTVTNNSSLATSVWPTAPISALRLPSVSVRAVVVGTTGGRARLEQARTALDLAWPDHGPAATLSEISNQSARQIAELQQMTNVVIVVSLVIAGCSLAVSVTGGVNDRKRPFSLLRLTGVPIAVLRRVVGLEAAVPLLVISVLSVGIGFLAAGLFLRSQLSESLQMPGPGYFILVTGGLVASLAVVACTLPLLERITGPEVARNE